MTSAHEHAVPVSRPVTVASIKLRNRDFLQAIFGEDWRKAYVTGFAGDPKDAGGAWAGALACDRLAGFRAGDNTYFCISTFQPPGYGKPARRRRETFEACHAIVVDDVGTKVDRATVLAKLGAPTYRLETSPDNEQWGFALRSPETNPGRVDALLSGLVATGIAQDGKDPGMTATTRYVRLPEGTNGKAIYGAGGFRHRLLEWEPARRFTMEELATGYGIDLSAAPKAKTITLRPDAENDVVLKALQELGLVQGTSKDGQIVDITCPFAAEHTGGDTTGTAYLSGGGFKCHHGHCRDRPRTDFVAELASMLREQGDAAFFARHDFADVEQEADAAMVALVLRGGKPTNDELAPIAEILAARPDLAECLEEVGMFAPTGADLIVSEWQARIEAVAAAQNRKSRAVAKAATTLAPVGEVLAPAGSAPALMSLADLEAWTQGVVA
jgi:hypothetical protein